MTVYVNTANKGILNMRAQPTPTGKILAQIPYKTSLEVEYVDSTWSKTTYNGQIGYVKTEYLSNGKSITKSDLQQIYNSLKNALETIEKILK
jgi:uncharacterized protein YgiM (DUF1202 family)